jgi:hypothetical protein
MVALGIPRAHTVRFTGIGIGVRNAGAGLYSTTELSPGVIASGAWHGALFGLIGAGAMFAVLALIRWPAASPDARRLEGLGFALPHNPLFRHLSRVERGRWPSPQATLWLFAGLFLASVALGVLAGLYSRGPTTLRFLTLIGLGVLFFVPMVVAAMAATMALQSVGDGSHQLLQLTLLSKREVVGSYVLATLYRLRVLLALAIGPTPLLIAGQLFMMYRVRSSTPLPEPPLGPTLLKVTMVAVGLLGANILAAATGVLLAMLARRTAFVAITYSPLFVAAVMTPLLSTLMGGSTTTRTAYVSEFIGILLFMLIPYILSFEIIRAARRWVWSDDRRLLVRIPSILD